MKLKSILIIAAVALLASCSNPESLLKKYEAACESGNTVKAAQVFEEIEEKFPNDSDWTEEQLERFEEASLTLTKKATEDALNALGAMGDLF
jgi:hypothetical protein